MSCSSSLRATAWSTVTRGSPLAPYLVFPPITQRIETTTFSWVTFFAIGLPLFVIILICVLRAFRFPNSAKNAPMAAVYPWWGWAGLGLTILGWGLAWTRFPWFHQFQLHTFTPLWIGYIIVMSGLTWKRTGSCLLTNRPRLFSFPFSFECRLLVDIRIFKPIFSELVLPGGRGCRCDDVLFVSHHSIFHRHSSRAFNLRAFYIPFPG